MTENESSRKAAPSQLNALLMALETLMPEIGRLIMLLSEADGDGAGQRLEQLIEAMSAVASGLRASELELADLLNRLGALPQVLDRLKSIELALMERDGKIDLMSRQMDELHRWMSGDA